MSLYECIATCVATCTVGYVLGKFAVVLKDL